ncbi:hypothetical protein VTL71DRAFT_4745 [Oculimacula yallundae]|uniref:Uncharacterized protein n=1 Tax=Oculimacula yallundae TaxID=86028 RepID=A0ABR4C408_9HELO
MASRPLVLFSTWGNFVTLKAVLMLLAHLVTMSLFFFEPRLDTHENQVAVRSLQWRWEPVLNLKIMIILRSFELMNDNCEADERDRDQIVYLQNHDFKVIISHFAGSA